MKKHRIASVVIFIQAIGLPILFGSLRGPDRGTVFLFQALIAVVCIAVFAEKTWAVWVALALMVIQLPVIETELVTWRITAGSALSIGILKGPSWLDSRIGLNFFSGYIFNGAIFRSPVQRLFTDSSGVTGAFLMNLAVVPAIILLGVRRK